MDYMPLTSSWQDCRDAAISLGLNNDTVCCVDFVPQAPWGKDRPQGCFRSTGGERRIHFNTGEGGNFKENDFILCKSGNLFTFKQYALQLYFPRAKVKGY